MAPYRSNLARYSAYISYPGWRRTVQIWLSGLAFGAFLGFILGVLTITKTGG